MNLQDRAHKFLEKNQTNKSLEPMIEIAEDDWLEIKNSLDENIIQFINRNSKNLKTLQMKEVDLYNILKKFDFMESVVDCHIHVLLQRNKSIDEGNWIDVKQSQKPQVQRQKVQKMDNLNHQQKSISTNQKLDDQEKSLKDQFQKIQHYKDQKIDSYNQQKSQQQQYPKNEKYQKKDYSNVQENSNQNKKPYKKESYVKKKKNDEDFQQNLQKLQENAIQDYQQKYEKLEDNQIVSKQQQKSAPYIPSKNKNLDSQSNNSIEQKDQNLILQVVKKEEILVEKININEIQKKQDKMDIEDIEIHQRSYIQKEIQEDQNLNQIFSQTDQQKLFKKLKDELDKPVDLNQHQIDALENSQNKEITQLQEKYKSLINNNQIELNNLREKIAYLENIISTEKKIWNDKIMHLNDLLNQEKKIQQNQIQQLEQEHHSCVLKEQQTNQDLQQMKQKYDKLEIQYEKEKKQFSVTSEKGKRMTGIPSNNAYGTIIQIQQQNGLVPHLLLQQISGPPLLMPVTLSTL